MILVWFFCLFCSGFSFPRLSHIQSQVSLLSSPLSSHSDSKFTFGIENARIYRKKCKHAIIDFISKEEKFMTTECNMLFA